LEPTSIDGCGASCEVCDLFTGATTTCDGSSCSVECDSPDFFLDDTGCHPGATQVSISQTHSCVRLFDGTLRCWGSDFSGELGRGSIGTFRDQPAVPNIDGVLAVGVGRQFSCALRTDGSVWCWGANGSGQLGRGNGVEADPNPAPVVGIDDALELSVGELHACVTRPSGLYCWGDNSFGAVGPDASVPTQPLPVRVDIEPFSEVSAGGRSTCALLSGSGAVSCWGQSPLKELAPDPGDSVRAVVVQGTVGCVVLQSSAVRCWGQDGSSAVVPFADSGTVSSLALGPGVACVVSSQGLASCSGANNHGQLGRGSTSASEAQLAPVNGLDGARQLSAGPNHVCALRSDGSVWCWGSNSGGELGTYRV
jgi:alpha-tubulin suppressor-like RCC1 family protein